MKWLLMTLLLSSLAYAQAVELTREDLQKIVAQALSADVITELQLYPAGECRFRLKINLAEAPLALWNMRRSNGTWTANTW